MYGWLVVRSVGLCCWGCSAVRRECAWHSKKESQRETPTPKYVDYIQSRFPFKADASGGHCYCWQILRPVATIILIILGERAFWIPWRLQQANGDEFLKPDSQTDDPQGTMGRRSEGTQYVAGIVPRNRKLLVQKLVFSNLKQN